MKRVLLAVVTGALLTLSSLAHADTIGVSIQLQQDQIVSDAKTGMLLQPEVQTLTNNLNRIKFEYKRAKSHGVMNHYEIRQLEQMLAENEATLLRYRQNKRK